MTDLLWRLSTTKDIAMFSSLFWILHHFCSSHVKPYLSCNNVWQCMAHHSSLFLIRRKAIVSDSLILTPDWGSHAPLCHGLLSVSWFQAVSRVLVCVGWPPWPDMFVLFARVGNRFVASSFGVAHVQAAQAAYLSRQALTS